MRVMLADDSVLLREGVARLLTEAGFDVAGQAGDAPELLRMVKRDPPDVVVLDIRMPPTFTDEGIQAARAVRAAHPDVGVLVLSQYVESAYAVHLLADGSDGVGYLLKDRVANLSALTEALHRVQRGEPVIDAEVVRHLVARQRDPDPLERLTEREREVLARMAEGHSNRAIADKLVVSLKTVETHVASVFTKLDLPPAAAHHRRVLAVLTYLRSR